MATEKDFARIRELLAEKKNREQAALKLFRPMPHQEPFFKSTAMKRIIRGGNRCLGGEQQIYDPVSGVSRRVDEIDAPFHVQSVNPETGELVTGSAGVPFVKAVDGLYRFHLSNGNSFVASMNHVVLAGDGWRPLRTCVSQTGEVSPIPLRSTSGLCIEAFPRDVPNWIEITQDSLGDYQSCSRSCDEQPHASQVAFRESGTLQDGVQGYTFRERLGGRGHKQEHSRSCPAYGLLASLGDLLLWLVRVFA